MREAGRAWDEERRFQLVLVAIVLVAIPLPVRYLLEFNG